MTPSAYRGRFAPTPSGPLHLGSLLAALASFLQARWQRGQWLLRIDDLDRQRVMPGAESAIYKQLEAHGLLWDEPPRRQTEHVDEYRSALQTLIEHGEVYACRCTRAQLARSALPGPDEPVYAETCRNAALPLHGAALRIRTPDQDLRFHDGVRGVQSRNLRRDIGDWVVLRRDGVIAYQLACAVDEHAQRITEVVRGCDLLTSTFRQLYLMERLRLRAPRYRHMPLLVDAGGRKLSKQNRAVALDAAKAADNLLQCLEWLGQQPPPALRRAPVAEILAWATGRWNPSAVTRQPIATPQR